MSKFYMLVGMFFLLGTIVELPAVAESYWLKSYPVTVISWLSSLIDLPWSFTIVYGMMADLSTWKYSIIGCLALIVGIIWQFISEWCMTFGKRDLIVGLLFCCEFLPVIGLVFATALMVQTTQNVREDTPKICSRVFNLGRAIGAVLGGRLLGKDLDFVHVYQFQALLTLCFANYNIVCALNNPVEKITLTVATGNEVAYDLSEIKIYLFLLGCMPTSTIGVNYYMMGQLPTVFTTLAMGIIFFIYYIGVIAGTFLCFDTTWKLFLGSSILNMLSQLPILAMTTVQNGEFLFCIAAFSSFLTALNESMLSVSFSTKISKSIPLGNEGYRYNCITAIPGFGKIFGIILSNSLLLYYGINHDKFDNLMALQTIVVCCTVIPMAFALHIIK